MVPAISASMVPELSMVSLKSPLLQLPEELISEILTWLDQPLYNEKLDRRAYLSQESFSMPARPSRDCARDVSNFRRCCKRLAEMGAAHQFARITTRFSQRGLDRLEQLCSWPHLARHVMKFSYLVRNYYIEGPERMGGMPAELESDIGIAHLNSLQKKLREQQRILSSGQDIKVLCKALAAFQKLQHIQILRVQDHEDDVLLQRLKQDGGLSRFFDLGWAQACAHSTSTIGKAIMMSQSPCSRFSSPMLSPQSAQILAAPLSKYMPLASRLTSLEIHFDDGLDMDERLLSISDATRLIFKAATNMQAIHIGFPSHRPVSLRLEDLFHHVTWRNLKAFGIQSWRLDADEIIQFARRHKSRLRGLRLRDVLLKDRSIWTDVLRFLRDEMLCLEWVSLRRIGYAAHFDEQLSVAGAEVPDDPPDMGSDSEDDPDNYNLSLDGPVANSTQYDSDGSSVETFVEALEEGSETSETDNGPQAHQMDFPDMSSSDQNGKAPCSCRFLGLYPSNAGDLGDDGVFVSNNVRKLWEKWILRRCPLHGTFETAMNGRE